MKKLYLITGANGHLGNTLIRQLKRRGCQVRGLILPSESLRDDNNIVYYKGDVRQKETLLPLFEDTEDAEITMIHTAGIIDISEKVSPALYDVNVNGTKNIAALCLKKRVQRMVYVSSVHAIPEKSKPHVLQEVAVFSADQVRGGYAKTKADATQAVLDLVKEGLNAVIVQPSGILGPYDSSGNHLVQLVSNYINGHLPACVNGGYLMQPYVVESLLDEDGLAVYNHKPKVVRRVISEETSKTVCSILEQVVGDPNEGTGRNAAVAGYRIGGKTGTSEKVSYEAQTGKKEYIVSFIGFAPADDPQIALLVMLDSPGSGSGVYVSGGQMAAPTVGKMFADILPYMGIEPKYDESSEKADKPVPDLNGLSVDDAKTKLSENGFDCRLIGSGTTVTAQLPLTGCVIAEGSTVIIYADASPSAALETMPGIKGLSYADAVKELSKYGVFARSNTVVRDAENQKVLTQSVKAGADIKHGTVVEVTLVSDDESILGRY